MVLDFLNRNRVLILVPLIVCVVLGTLYSLLTPRGFMASQTLMLRDDLLGDSFKPGRFQSEESLKNAQETVLHLARKPAVIAAALSSTYPEKYSGITASSSEVESFQGKISISPPNGAEFGKTDVIILNVKASSPDMASCLATSLHSEVEKNLRLVRADRLTSMQNELRAQYEQAFENYSLAANKVREIEDSVGEDLESLRAMTESHSGNGELHRALEQIRNERRVATDQLDLIEKQLQYLQQLQSDGEQVLATNNELMRLQPALDRLYNGLVDAKLKLASAEGIYRAEHPTLKTNRNAVEATRMQIQLEISTIQDGLEQQKNIANQRLKRLEASEDLYRKRSLIVNKNRVEYQTISNELTRRGEAMAKLQNTLAEVESCASTEHEYNLLTSMGVPEVKQASGMSRASLILLAAILGGCIGLGIAILVDGPMPELREHLTRFANSIESKITTRTNSSKAASTRQTTDASRPFGSGTKTPSKRPASILRDTDVLATRDSVIRDIDESRLAKSAPAIPEQTKAKPAGPDKPLVGLEALASIDAFAAPTDEELTVIQYDSPLPVQPAQPSTSSPATTATFDIDLSKSNMSEPSGRNIAASHAMRETIGRNAAQTMMVDEIEIERVRKAVSDDSVPANPAADDSSQSATQKRLKERLEKLSHSISAYCQPIRKETDA